MSESRRAERPAGAVPSASPDKSDMYAEWKPGQIDDAEIVPDASPGPKAKHAREQSNKWKDRQEARKSEHLKESEVTDFEMVASILPSIDEALRLANELASRTGEQFNGAKIIRSIAVKNEALGADTLQKLALLGDDEIIELVTKAREIDSPALETPEEAVKKVELRQSDEPTAPDSNDTEVLQSPDEAAAGVELRQSDEPTAPDDPERAKIDMLYETRIEMRDKYAELTAKDRGSYLGRFAKSGLGKFMNKMSIVDKLISTINERSAAQILEAQRQYQTAQEAVERAAFQNMHANAEELRGLREGMLIDEAFALEAAIADATDVYTKAPGRLAVMWSKIDSWAGNSTWRKIAGKGAKASMIVLGGGATGVAAGALLPFTVLGVATGAIAGGAAGGLMAHKVTQGRRRANALDFTGDAMRNPKEGTPESVINTFTNAQLDAVYDMNAKRDLLKNNPDTNIGEVVTHTEGRTDEEVLHNRRRLKTAIGMGATAGGLGGIVGVRVRESINSLFGNNNAPAYNMTPQRGPDGDRPSIRYGDVGGDVVNNHVDVTGGESLTDNWMQWGQANGHPMDNNTAHELHKAIRQQFGDHYLQGVDTYIENGDLRLQNTGSGQWANGVGEFAQKWLQSNGKW